MSFPENSHKSGIEFQRGREVLYGRVVGRFCMEAFTSFCSYAHEIHGVQLISCMFAAGPDQLPVRCGA